MNTYNQDEVNINLNRLLQKIDAGKIFVYPTDTIYGIGCDATNDEAVKKVREAKNRHQNPFSVIAPSKDWISQNCEVNDEVSKWLEKLPGPYTLILKLKNKNAISPLVNNHMDTIGVRIPKHWISKFTGDSGKPIVTTSANKQGQDFMTTLESLDSNIKSMLNFIIYEGELKGRPSTLVHLAEKEIKILER